MPPAAISSTRPAGSEYIDEVQQDDQFQDAESSGSSIEEEVEDEVEVAIPETTSGVRDYDLLDSLRARSRDIPEDSSGSEETWDVEDEDWDLANGDFTKQYNRMRQTHGAMNGSSGSALPARNTGQKQSQSGVTTNPKMHEKVVKDKSDRATTEQVLDGRTRLVLSALTNRGLIGKLGGCISTGKEANVYPASTETQAVVVKIYRTSILNFRSRQSYIEGEYRFKGEYTSSKNPRKMVRLWAEKELRNLRRLEHEGIPSPKAIEVKENVLVMEYLGDERAAPRLRDAELSKEQLRQAYLDLVVTIRRIFQLCKLVHADLSEYNVLYHRGIPYIIDVSQSVEHDHPRAFDFLRKDIRNIEDYFKREDPDSITLGYKRCWDFVTASTIGLEDEKEENAIPKSLEILSERLQEPADPASDAVFMESFIPRNLGEVYDPERDVELLMAGKAYELIYAGTTGLDSKAKSAATSVPEAPHESDEESDPDDDEDNDEAPLEQSRGFRHEDRDAKKERKKAVKEENREKRKTKMPKAQKQRLVKKSAR